MLFGSENIVGGQMARGLALWHPCPREPPIFSRSSAGIHTYVFTGGFVLVRGSFDRGVVQGFLSEKFCPGWFLFVPPSVRIHPLQQNAKHHLEF